MSDSTSKNGMPDDLQAEADAARETAKRETEAARAYAEEQVNEARKEAHRTK